MTDTNARKCAESLFDRETRREAEIADALKQEQAHDAAIRNMHRLRCFRAKIGTVGCTAFATEFT